MSLLVPIGRLFYGAIFVTSGLNHFSPETAAYAASQGVGAPLVWIAGLLALLGGLSVALGWRARLGSGLLALFLVPVTLTMHRFWGLDDPQAAMQQQIHFMKNLSMLGGALLIAYYGAGPFSLDARRAFRPPRWRPSRQPVRV